MQNIFLESEKPGGLGESEIRRVLEEALAGEPSPRRVLLLPPDITRMHSYAGPVAAQLLRLLPDAQIDIMPALGTHVPMTAEEIARMYPELPAGRFLAHDWRRDVVKLGEVPSSFMAEVSEGRVQQPLAVEINRRIVGGGYDRIFSIGQVVPHEVVGMANYNKNLFVGCGGSAMINGSHYLGALHGMERMMGRDNTPVHRVFDYAEAHFLADIPLCYLLTVTSVRSGKLTLHSLAAGRDRSLFRDSIRVSQRHNLNFLDKPLKKVIVYLDPDEFRTTWIGNKAIYRTRMAMADGGELLIIAPGVKRFGEDMGNDELIRRFGYCGRDRTLAHVDKSPALRDNLGVAAHLIHGCPEGRFRVVYAPGHMTREEIEGAGFAYMPLPEALEKYEVAALKDGFNTMTDGEEIFYISNPALGLWALRSRFENA